MNKAKKNSGSAKRYLLLPKLGQMSLKFQRKRKKKSLLISANFGNSTPKLGTKGKKNIAQNGNGA